MAKTSKKIKSVSSIKKDNMPIEIDELNSLKFEILKLKIDKLVIQKKLIDSEISLLSKHVSQKITDLIQQLNIPNDYKLDFNVMKFVYIGTE